MNSAKDILLKPIDSRLANDVVKMYHYSKKVVQNSSIHLGVYLNGEIEGAMQFGPSMDKRKMLGLVDGTGWNDFIELNRMAFGPKLPRNSESRALSISMRLLRKYAPHLQWVVSFADATQCGDGTIYRASGFHLTGIRENSTLWEFPTGDRLAGMSIEADWDLKKMKEICFKMGVEHKYRTRSQWRELGAKPLPGFQLRYIYFLDKEAKNRLTVPLIPFDKIKELGASMYLGKAF